MAKLVRRLLKLALFIGLLRLSIRFIPLSNEWSLAETRAWIRASDWLGVDDPDDLYFAVWLTIEAIVAAVAYVAIVKLWRYYRARRSARL
ncbi:hypothetical protein LJ656_23650 [Paraburkholderia sp. MMS20-SJTR3]|uniref:Uncharacterized protein n=1 Tax=Paraburkholderia sejongensis TaxID=2886946 RepID=A0ABS8K0P9_9BURK|nr:hypothetical protein [Paraburkholderia sp. MMS20-SJTR3]MCC8395580.1 hypothetical protein [Paraburkholderia sp. MMS20-SJTR3]